MNLYTEGAAVLDSAGLEPTLAQFGEVQLGGSYAYRTMVDRDIDFDVILPDESILSYELRSVIGEKLLKLPQLRSLKMSDPYHFPAGSKHQIDGIWFGLTMISEHTAERWNIDIWFLKSGANTEQDGGLTEKLLHLSDSDREAIVAIKQACLDAGKKEKGRTSTQVYEAVLEHGVRTYDEFVEYLEKIRESLSPKE